MATAVSEKQRNNVVNNSEDTVGVDSKSALQNGSADVSSDPVSGSVGVDNKSSNSFSMSQYLQQEGSRSGHPVSEDKSVNVKHAISGDAEGPPGGYVQRGSHGEPLGGSDPSSPYRHGFPNTKTGMIPPRSPGGVFSQQRFMSGQSISQPTGPTPTLNQLLQTTNAIQRMQNSYGHSGGPDPGGIYSQQSWPPQQSPHSVYGGQSASSPGAPPGQVYRNPSPELAGQNSNDSCSGAGAGAGAPGTPNSQQGMRPTPSPTGSTGSRSMSPAVGQQNIQMPPRPSSSQSDGSGPTRMNHSPMATQGGYQGPPPPPHIAGYKLPGGAGASGPPGSGQPLPPYSAPQQQGMPPQPHSQYSSPQGNYTVRPQGNMQYGPNQVYGGLPNPGQPNASPNLGPNQYPSRSMPNHFPGYPQSWSGSPSLNQGPPGPPNKGGPGGVSVSQPSSTSPSLHSTNSQSSRPPNYLKQHLQHKMTFGGSGLGIVPSHSPPQGYGMGPPGSGAMHHPGPMGPPPMGGGGHIPMSMGPPNMAPPSSTNSHDSSGGPMPPPSTTPNSHTSSIPEGDSPAHDNGITTTAAGNVGTHVTSAGGGTVTSVVTTGPDGTPLDEGSQQSTLSNASVASGEDPQCSTPKSRKSEMGGGGSGGGHYSHPATPQSTVPSPGAASINSMHGADEYDISSPSWPRTPASPVFNSHVPPPETYRSKKSDSLSKLYEMDDSPERRAWLDKLLAFMEERRTPITTCPTISKNPLDLFRLYIFVKERGGFMEVTKNKTWKDIAGMLGIGASSSAAYTLRKHYTKNLLAFECKFDRGGIDPQPIINQVEATSKKKSAKAASVPSPGSSNSQDSFPTPGSGNASMDGYGAYGYPSGSTADYNSPPMQRPSSQANAPSPHPGVANHHGQQGNATGDNISVSNPFDDVASGQPQRYPGGAAVSQSGSPYGPGGAQRGQGYPGQPAGGYSQYPAPGSSPDPYQNYSNNSSYPPTTRPVGYPSYSPDGERGGGTFNQSGSSNMTTSMASNMATNNPTASTAATAQDPYNRYGAMGGANQATAYVPPPPAGTRQTYTSGASTTPPSSQSSSQPQPGSYPGQQDYYRNDPNYPSGGGQTSPGGGATATQVYGNGPHSKAMPPPAPQPRRHPDFAKDQQYPPYSQQKPQMYGWPNNQYRGQYPGQAGAASSSTTGQQWAPGSGPVRGTTPAQPGGPAGAVPGPTSWGSDHRYPPSPGTTGQPGTTPAGYQSSVQPPPGQQQWSGMSAPGQGNSLRPAGIGTRPPFRAEGKPTFNMPPPQGLKTTAGPSSTTGSSYTPQPIPKREITFPSDSVEATTPVLYRRKRLCRADVAPLDAWRIMMCLRSGLLAESTWALDVLNVLLFDDSSVAYFGLAHMPGLLDVLLEHFQRSLSDMFDTGAAESRNDPWYEKRVEECETVDLGAVEKPIDPEDHTVVLSDTPDYTMVSRKGRPVKAVPKDDIFVLDTDKDWDVDGEQSERSVAEATTDPWHPLGAVDGFESTKHILTCFRAEFGDIPFARVLRPHEKSNTTVSVSTTDGVNASETNGEELEEGECDGDDRKTISGDGEKTVKRRTTKSLSDVLARIKDSAENARREEKENKTESEADVPDASGEASGGSDMCGPSCTPDSRDSTGGPHIRDPAGTLKRRRVSDYEDEAYSRDESSLYLVTETQESLGKRCVCISNVLRNLTFVPGNETEFAKSPAFLGLLGKLLLLHHDHPPRTPKTRNYDREEDADFAEPRPGTSGARDGEAPWWWDFLAQARENALVAAANVAGHMDLGAHDEAAARPVLDGLLHWAVCPSAHGQDALPSAGPTSALSPRRLALEALCKLCVTDSNVDLVVATPPYSRLERLCAILTKMLCRSEEPTLREFAINLLHYLSAADSGVARTVALQSPCVSLLVAFIEQAEQSALGIANQHGVGALRDNPDAMGTSLDMLRRAARTLLHLARHPDNRPLFLQQEQRLLGLVMSQILDQQVASIVSRVLYQCSRPPDALPPSSS